MRLTAVPGLGLGPEAWRPALSALVLHTGARAGTVHLLPGYGVPTASRRAPVPAELGAVLARRLAGPTTLLGHSSSCQVVAHAARLRPDLVRAIVLACPTTDPRAASWPGLAGLWLRTAAHEDPRQVPLLLRQYRRTTLRSMLTTMDAARRDDLRRTLSLVTAPVVLVRGAQDRIARPDWLATLAGTGPGRSVVEVPAGAHMVPLTHPRLFADHVGPLLAGHGS
ncbi:MAG TPA: alpha/beta hydrolase [Nocardioides sp.]|nr:alpha/beta hydrolase [Nocardioides sp.]